MPRISLIFGTRPEAVKLAPVILALRREASLDIRVCVTAQHRGMLDQVLEVFGIAPDADLHLMRPDQALGELTARAMAGLDAYLADEKPDLVLVQGDTTTVFCAALAAFYHGIRVAHVEAGLRTGRRDSPFPEEINRVLTTRVADLHFAPTERSRENLLAERIPADAIHVTGNTVIDALLLARRRIAAAPPRVNGLPAELQPAVDGPRIVLITGHRRENFGEGFRSICRTVARLAGDFPDHHFVYPVHLNPNVQAPVRELLSGAPNIHLIDPLDYLPFVALMDRAHLILTDSGGVQEEAPSLGKPVLVLRDTTERPEAVEAGTAKLVGTDEALICSETARLLVDGATYADMARAINPYGDGQASGRIVAACRDFLRT